MNIYWNSGYEPSPYGYAGSVVTWEILNGLKKLGHSLDVEPNKADVCLIIWNPRAVITTKHLKIPRLVYHGDIEPQVKEERLIKNWDLFEEEKPSFRNMIGRKWEIYWDLEQHMKEMMKVETIANVCHENAAFYKRKGHPRSIYIPNTWSYSTDMITPAPNNKTKKIIGHFSNLNRTGSTFGLHYLLMALMPELDKALTGMDWEVHIIGGGEISPVLKPYLRHPKIRMRGYVPDLEKELKTSDVVLMMNNAGPYRAAFTRHMVCWSMGLCLVVHQNSREAIWEAGELRLNDPSSNYAFQLGQQIRNLLLDKKHNEYTRQQGLDLYKRYFTPTIVAGKISMELGRLVNAKVPIQPEV